jgi:hypothetical protein
MQFLTKDQCAAWVTKERFRFAAAPSWRDLEKVGFHATRFATPADAGARIALARILWSSVSDQSERLLWMTEWGVWPSSEHMPLYASLRQVFGDKRRLIDAPGHLFQLGEDDNGLSFLIIAAVFLWDVYLLGSGGDFAAFLSHDEFCVVLNRDKARAAEMEQRLASFIKPAA